MRYKVLIADEEKILTDGLTAVLSPYFEIAGSAANGHELVFLARKFKPDVIVSEICMPELNLLDALKVIRKAGVKSRFIVLTSHTDVYLAIEAFRAGVAGYVMKHAGKEELIAAIRSVIDGRDFLSSRFPVDLVTLLSEAVRRPENGRPNLTKRQREVLQLVAEGKTMKEVAVALSISTRTAEAYKYEIMRLLGLHHSTELVHYAIRIGLLTIPRMEIVA